MVRQRRSMKNEMSVDNYPAELKIHDKSISRFPPALLIVTLTTLFVIQLKPKSSIHGKRNIQAVTQEELDGLQFHTQCNEDQKTFEWIFSENIQASFDDTEKRFHWKMKTPNPKLDERHRSKSSSRIASSEE